MKLKNRHIFFMKRAIALAKKGMGTTSPNPMVGAVIVKNGKIVAEGYHPKAGGPHAEIVALKKLNFKANGCDLYVNLEPCDFYGRTPPCTDAIIKSGITRVIIGTLDQNPKTSGKGVCTLKKHGITVITDVLEPECYELNEPFFKFITKKQPYVTLKAGMSLDGMIGLKNGKSQWITSENARKLAHERRCFFDAIMVGVNTILNDNPLLSNLKNKKIIKVILDPKLETPRNARIFSDINDNHVILCIRKGVSLNKRKPFEHEHITINEIPFVNDTFNLDVLLNKLAAYDVVNLLLEGGSVLYSTFINEKRVDRVNLFIAPSFIGSKNGLPLFSNFGLSTLTDQINLTNVSIKKIDTNWLINARLIYS